MKKLLVLIFVLMVLTACGQSVRPQTGPTPSASPLPYAPTEMTDTMIVGVVAPWTTGVFNSPKGQVGVAIALKAGNTFDVTLRYDDQYMPFSGQIPELEGVPELERVIAECPPVVVFGPPYIELTWRRFEMKQFVICVGEEFPKSYTITDNSTGEVFNVPPPSNDNRPRA